MGDSADERRLITFRRQLLSISESLTKDEVDSMKFVYRSRMPVKKYFRIEEGYQLFAYLEQKDVLTVSSYHEVLTSLLEVCERDARGIVSDFTRILRSFLPLNFESEVDIMTTEEPTSQLEELYRTCIAKVTDGLAKEDSSLQKLIYVCVCLPLKYVEQIKDGFALIQLLEKRGLLSCWKLSYLFRSLQAADRHDLCSVIQLYTKKALVAAPTHHTRALQRSLYDRSYSSPERLPSSLGQQPSVKPMCQPLRILLCKGILYQSPTDHERALTGPSVVENRSQFATHHSDSKVDSRFSVFDHPTYHISNYIFSFRPVYPLLVSIMLLTCVMTFVKFPVEWIQCGPATAILNLVGRVLTHGGIPFYVLSTIPSILRDSKVKSCKFVSYPNRKDTQEVLTRVVKKLSTDLEWQDLEKVSVSPVKKVNFLLHQKLSYVSITSLVQSTTFSVCFFLIISANWSTFTGLSTDTFARLYCFVMITTSLLIHGSVTLSVSLYLFEMRMCEYLTYVIHYASKKKAKEVVCDAKQLKQVLESRWKSFSLVFKCFSLAYIVILALSVFFRAPFRCKGGKEIDFTEDDLADIPSSWLCWILVSFMAQLLVCWYRVFIHGRIIAILVQVFVVAFLIYQRVEGHHPKWVGLLQIVHVLYPLVYGLSMYYVVCCHMWTRTSLRTKCDSFLIVCKEVVKNSTFLFNFVLFLLTCSVAIVVLCLEYQSLHDLTVN